MLSIIVPVWNRLDLTRSCLEHLWAAPPRDDFEVVVVDNGSTDGTGEWLASRSDLTVVTHDDNLGFSRACNAGARVAEGDVLVFLNNDVDVDPGFADVHVDVLAADDRVAAVGSRLYFPGRRELQHAGVVVLRDERPDAVHGFGAMHRYYRRAADFAPAARAWRYQVVTAALMSVRADAFDAVGGFDEGYWNGFEDVDLCFKLGVEGGLCVYEPRSTAIHHESASGPERFARTDANVARLAERWEHRIQPDVVIDGRRPRAGADSPIGPYVPPVVAAAG